MRKLSYSEVQDILILHKKWLNGDKGGKRAVIRKAKIEDMNLEKKDMRYVEFYGVSLNGSRFNGSNFTGARIQWSSLVNTEFIKAILRKTKMTGSDMTLTVAIKADFSYTNSSDVIFTGARLQKAKFIGAELWWANFHRANIYKTNFTGAKLTGIGLPTWSGASDFRVDIDFVYQLLAQICSLEVNDDEFIEIRKKILKYALRSDVAENFLTSKLIKEVRND